VTGGSWVVGVAIVVAAWLAVVFGGRELLPPVPQPYTRSVAASASNGVLPVSLIWGLSVTRLSPRATRGRRRAPLSTALRTRKGRRAETSRSEFLLAGRWQHFIGSHRRRGGDWTVGRTQMFRLSGNRCSPSLGIPRPPGCHRSRSTRWHARVDIRSPGESTRAHRGTLVAKGVR